jgi:hypothetical protein
MSPGLGKGDRELEEYRDIMAVPDKYEDGFSGKTVLGAIFLGLFMVPGSMYLSLFMGGSLGAAAQWVTVILFSEVARRSLKSLKQQEIFILFYMTGIALSSPFQGLLWNQYLVRSPEAQAMGVAPLIPSWVAPSAEQIRQTGNTFFNRLWLAPVLLISLQLLISRVNGFGLGYVLYRLLAHYEKLPFPMAPVSAQGVLVLAEDKENRNRWRLTTFSIGAMLGALFGFIYIGIPSLTGSVLGTPYQLLPNPWLDLTVTTQNVLHATPVNLVFDLTVVIVGMVLPFWAVIGGFIGMVLMLIANPLLQHYGRLPTWQLNMGLVDTLYSNQVDFYLSFGIGLTFAVFFISLGSAAIPLLRKMARGGAAPARPQSSLREAFRRVRLRGDIPIWISLAIYVLSTIGYIAICLWLIPGFPWGFFLIFAFAYTPLISYVSAKLEGLVGQAVSIPLVRESAYILSGYKGVAIWFAPIPLVDYGQGTQSFRVVELTGTKVTSLIKTELVTIPVVIVASFLFSEFIWRLGPIPSEQYPFTQQMWRLYALNSCLTITSTMSGGSKFLDALVPMYVAIGLGFGLVTYIGLWMLSLPTLLMFGLVRGMGAATPGQILSEFIGALLGRYFFMKKFGVQRWRQMAPVVLAGWLCGLGLMAMASVGIALIAKSISTLLY